MAIGEGRVRTENRADRLVQLQLEDRLQFREESGGQITVGLWQMEDISSRTGRMAQIRFRNIDERVDLLQQFCESFPPQTLQVTHSCSGADLCFLVKRLLQG